MHETNFMSVIHCVSSFKLAALCYAARLQRTESSLRKAEKVNEANYQKTRNVTVKLLGPYRQMQYSVRSQQSCGKATSNCGLQSESH